MFFGDSFCQNFVQEDVTNAVKKLCTETSNYTATSNALYKAITTRLETLESKLDTALLQLSVTKSIIPCPFGYEYFETETFCYRFHTECKTWSEARKVCQQEGGDLIMLNDSNMDFFREMATKKSACVNVWVGATDTNLEGSWRWVNGETISQSLWEVDEPSHSPNENCADMQMTFGFKLNDIPCSYQFDFICQIVLNFT
ncbi:hypothetical protein CHS0354_039940 [Potamilus streckersoni]|uniref:C-type lectin domain-containing protein n=1 Tax=Potamilus streckersoni TaxID=2493646 RepID=A0AAE0WE18_9BIVA|nr:hypothetical protein CHS0354_039940 [Potamilus streckersoni]